MTCRRRAILDCLTVALFAWCELSTAARAAAAEAEWSRRPYRIHAIVAIDGPGQLAAQLAEALPVYLAERAEGAVGPLWELEIHVAQGAVRQRILNDLSSLAEDPGKEFSFSADKLVLLSVRVTADGYELAGREFDQYVGRWGAAIQRQTRQADAVGEQLFVLLHRVVAPLAQLEAADADNVILVLRGADLPPMAGDARGVRVGDVFLPMLRRTSRNGELLPKGGIQVLPWTFVQTSEVKPDGEVVGHVQSGARRPLATRRRGRVEQVGIALRADPGDTEIHLVSRVKPDASLAGYEVFAQNVGEEKQTPIGMTNHAGLLDVMAGSSAVQTLFVRHGSNLLARVPMVPGVERKIVIPVLDDGPRLQAETRLAALREELIDVVARRNIIMARARRKIEAGDFKEAQQLLAALDQLPGRSQFSQELARERRLDQSQDARAQKHIDQLIKGTETVLGQFLNAQSIRQLQEELRAAESKKAEK